MELRRRRRVSSPSLRLLEGRSLVSTLVPGNAGLILSSQFQPYGYSTYGSQLRNVTAARGRSTRVDAPFNFGPPAPTPDGWIVPTAPANIGVIDDSQFNDFGFSTLGFQMRDVSIGGAFVVDALDEGPGQDAYGGSSATTIGPRSAPSPIPPNLPDSPANGGRIVASQFNDGGFGNIGLQWGGVSVGGDLDVSYNSLIRYPDGEGPAPAATGVAAPTSAAGASAKPAASTNTGLIRSSQFNDGGFGNLGLQWSNVAVGGSVAVSADRVVIQPQSPGSTIPPVPPAPDHSTASATNTGHVVASQFNDGGFGQVGFQWSGVKVGGGVATSNNALVIQPERDGVGAITFGPTTFGRAAARGPGLASAGLTTSAVGPDSATSAQADGPTTNGATNSGRVDTSQFADGGFGDVGLQWRNVAVAGAVTAVHNQLSIQPENNGQGPITVRGVAFPNAPVVPPPSPEQPDRIPAADPALVVDDGVSPTAPLPTPTGPGDRSFQVDQATNSGDVAGSQFADGGFGDVGLQWRDVSVAGSVAIVHNSLSVQPEGSGLAGVSVSGVTFGDPVDPSAAAPAPRTTLRRLAVPSSPGPNGKNPPKSPTPARNRGDLDGRQFLSSRARDVTLQWSSAAVGADGLVIVHNVLTVENHGPGSAAVVLKDIRFPGQVPPLNFTPNLRAPAHPRPTPATSRFIDQATNSGTVGDGQFLDGGTGDVGLQWRGVDLGGDVRVVHNSLSVNVDADASGNGPVTISDVTFNSGLPDDVAQDRPDGSIVSPPRYASRINARAGGASGGRATPGVIDQSTNSGSINGGQFLSGGMGQVGLQWLDVDHPGPVTIVNNVLSVQVFGRQMGRITIENVRYT